MVPGVSVVAFPINLLVSDLRHVGSASKCRNFREQETTEKYGFHQRLVVKLVCRRVATGPFNRKTTWR